MRYLTMIKNQKIELFSSKLLKWNNRWTMDFIDQNEYMQAEKRNPPILNWSEKFLNPKNRIANSHKEK